ncbi:LOW QUALITY PROTEIN: hypothetical protein HID58_009307 [Brassica napus]|uniref:Uncharacterized protein n=1 Tax=Brassica napus TaxID=3708 RepID=A0ABQ8DS40_BRANA|nr:LOW QUALITY PROTEIN: hypothetical protein HID58_009307 [Brassica napus]
MKFKDMGHRMHIRHYNSQHEWLPRLSTDTVLAAAAAAMYIPTGVLFHLFHHKEDHQLQFPGVEDYDMETVMFHQRNRSSELNDQCALGTTNTTPTEDICEKPKFESEAKVESRGDRSKRVLRWGLSFFSVAVAGFAMWVHLKDDMVILPHLVPT